MVQDNIKIPLPCGIRLDEFSDHTIKGGKLISVKTLSGITGAGKTHFLHHLCSSAKEKYPEKEILFFTYYQHTAPTKKIPLINMSNGEMINKIKEFDLSKCSIICLDDILSNLTLDVDSTLNGSVETFLKSLQAIAKENSNTIAMGIERYSSYPFRKIGKRVLDKNVDYQVTLDISFGQRDMSVDIKDKSTGIISSSMIAFDNYTNSKEPQ